MRRRYAMLPEVLRRVGIGVVFALLVVLTGYLLVIRTSGAVRVGSGAPRTPEERRELLSSGDCALGAGGALLGRIVGSVPASRGNPQPRYIVEEAARIQSVQVLQSEVRVVPCTDVRDAK